MSNYYLSRLDDPKYHAAFWNAVRNKPESLREMGCVLDETPLPSVSFTKMKTALTENSLFRQIATVMQAHGSQYNIMAKDQDDIAAWIPENGEFPIYDGLNDFTIHPVERFKLGVFLKLDNAFIGDASFSIEDYLIDRLAKNFGEAETAAFISGAGPESGMPTGILADEGGAQVGVTTAAITYDNVIKLYFSVKPEYREKGVWLMNDETAFTLRTLKDADGNYLWNSNNDTILGKRVIITRHMPGTVSGDKPIAFGDFSYYWIVSRKTANIRTVSEAFIHSEQTGYLAYEFLDGKLIRPEAIKVLQMSA